MFWLIPLVCIIKLQKEMINWSRLVLCLAYTVFCYMLCIGKIVLLKGEYSLAQSSEFPQQ